MNSAQQATEEQKSGEESTSLDETTSHAQAESSTVLALSPTKDEAKVGE
jgi:hypothetical protein